ncbi:hypothetical protein, partial [Streptosporangium sp. NPDC048865]|uniref:hypothetical protein n=1 Tax=Streptosporangium sp. NPDC048865 TaxID=3155766 RepID=UPI00341A6E5E
MSVSVLVPVPMSTPVPVPVPVSVSVPARIGRRPAMNNGNMTICHTFPFTIRSTTATPAPPRNHPGGTGVSTNSRFTPALAGGIHSGG